jgi:putative PIN family toxin of toxin-antitoxin system
MLRVCIDTNIWLSGLIFSGVPKKIIDLAFDTKFELISSGIILDELEKNLIKKFKISK